MQPFYEHSSDEVASHGTIQPKKHTLSPQRRQKLRPGLSSMGSRSSSRDRGPAQTTDTDDNLPPFIHRSSMTSFASDDEDDTALPSARKGLPQVETETVNSVPLLGVPQQGSLKIKKSSEQMPHGNAHASSQNNGGSSISGSRAPSRQRRKRLAAASRADIFAAKIASAMDDAASSDSDETFVYDTNCDSVKRPYNLRTSSTISLPVSPAHPKFNRQNSNLYVQTVTASGPPTVNPSPLRGPLPEEEPRGRQRPPFLLDTSRRLSGTNKNDSVRAKHVYLNRWRGGELDSDDEDNGGPLIDESTPLNHLNRSGTHYAVPTPHDYGSNRRLAPLYIRVTLWFVGLAMCGMFCTFVVGVLVVSSRPLVGVQIARLVDVFPSDKELVLSMIVQAKNPGCFTVPIEDVDLDLFATSQYASAPPDDSVSALATKRTVLLGNLQELESPLTLEGSFFNPKNTFSMSTIRLVSPCGNATDLWQEISSHTFELTIRGVLKYSLLFSQDLRASVSSSVVVRGPDDALIEEVFDGN